MRETFFGRQGRWRHTVVVGVALVEYNVRRQMLDTGPGSRPSCKNMRRRVQLQALGPIRAANAGDVIESQVCTANLVPSVLHTMKTLFESQFGFVEPLGAAVAT